MRTRWKVFAQLAITIFSHGIFYTVIIPVDLKMTYFYIIPTFNREVLLYNSNPCEQARGIEKSII